jgi:hypothetical protein
MSDQAITVWITRWVLNSTCGKILKATGWPMAGKEEGLVIERGPGLRHGQIILGDWFDNEAAAIKSARKAITEQIKITNQSVVRLDALLAAVDTPDFIAIAGEPEAVPLKHAAE